MHITTLPFALLVLVARCSPTLAGSEIGFTPIDAMLHKFDLRQMGMSNLQTFNGNLGAPAPPIMNSGDMERPFMVMADTFPDFQSASQRTCDIQYNKCGDAANGPMKMTVTHDGCDSQKTACNSAQQNAPVKSFKATSQQNIGQDPNDPNFNLVCDM